MRFRASATFPTEALIDLTQRVVAQLQDLGVERVGQVSLYLSLLDRNGAPIAIELDHRIAETIDIPCSDLALPKPAPKIATRAATAHPSYRRQRSCK